MTARVRGKLLSQSFMLLCFSAAILLLGVQQQAFGQALLTQGVANTQIELPPLGPASRYLPLEEPSLDGTHDTRLVIKLSDRRIYVYRGNQLQVSYPIAIGKAGWETPTGTFEVMEMQRDPAKAESIDRKNHPSRCR